MVKGQQKFCDICDIDLFGNYCHNCGQKVSGKKLGLIEIIQDFLNDTFSLEKAGLGTMLLILKSPKKVINNYWEGNRRYYTSPFKLLIYASLIIGLHVTYNKNLIFGLAFTNDPKIFFIFLFLMVFTVSSYIQYYKRGFSFLETLIANTYLFSVLTIVLILLFEMIQILNLDDEIIGFSFLIGLVCLLSIYSSNVFSNKTGKLISLRNMIIHFVIILSILILTLIIGIVLSDLELSFN